MPTSTTQNTDMKRVYANTSGEHTKGEKHPDDPNREWDGKQWTLINKPTAKSADVVNTAKPVTAADLEDKPEDSPLIRASKRRQRAQREAMKQK